MTEYDFNETLNLVIALAVIGLLFCLVAISFCSEDKDE